MAERYFNQDGKVAIRVGNDSSTPMYNELVGSKIAYDTQDDMFKVKSLQKKWRDTFAGTSLDPEIWEVVSVGQGQSVQINTPGLLEFNLGTVDGAETVLLSKEVFTVPFRTMVGHYLSQRLAQNLIMIEMVSVDPVTLIPNNQFRSFWQYDTTSATQGKYGVQGGHIDPLISAASTISTTASQNIAEIEMYPDECWFHSRLMDSTNGRSNSYVRHQQIPNPNALYKLRLTARNVGTPASATTWGIQYATVIDYAELTAEITASRGSGIAGQALPVLGAGGTIATVSTVSTMTTGYVSPKSVFYADSTSNVTTATPYVSTARDCGSTNLYSTFRVRINSDRAGKLEIFNGSSSTTTSNRLSGSWDVVANVPLLVEIPIVARYIGFRFTNTGGSTTTSFEAVSALMGC